MHKHNLENIQLTKLDSLLENVTTVLEKSLVERKSFSFPKEEPDKLVECSVKYSDYLESNLDLVSKYQGQSQTKPVKQDSKFHAIQEQT